MTFEHFDTNLTIENEYPKLVRDKIPEVVEGITGKKVHSRTLEDDKEYLFYLQKKVIEESHELAHAQDKEHVVEEVADVLELIDAFLDLYNIDHDIVKKTQEEKAKKRGGFKKRVLMLASVDD